MHPRAKTSTCWLYWPDLKRISGALYHLVNLKIPRGDVVCVRLFGFDFLDESKVADFDLVILEEDVFWLEISVKIALLVDVMEALGDLVYDEFDEMFGHGFVLKSVACIKLENVLALEIEHQV